MLQTRSRDESDDLRTSHDRPRRLPRDDVEILAFRHPDVEGAAFLPDLPFRERGAGVGREFDDVRVELPADAERLDEQEIPRDQRVLQSELLVGRRLPAAHLPSVVDVVVDERRGMDELERGGEVDCLADIMAAEGFEREEGDHRTDSLAARLDHVARDVLEERLLRHDAFPELRLDEGHFLGHAKVHGKRHPGGPNLCYRLGLFNDLRYTRVAPSLQRADPVESVPGTLATGENT